MSDAIAYQNKDIMSKIFSEQMGSKSLAVYGIHLPGIVRALKTNLPQVEANELRIDDLFLLEDGSLAIIDYESEYRQENKIKYLNYITRVLKKLLAENMFPVRLRMIVIYTADVEPVRTQSRLDAGCLQLSLEEAFLSELDSDQIIAHLTAKVLSENMLTNEEMMQYIIAPLTKKGKENQVACITDMIDLSDHIKNDAQKNFVLSGMLVFGDKVITPKDRERIWRRMSMTQIGMMFEMDKERAVKEAIEQNTLKVTEEVTEKVTREVTREVTEEVSTKTALKLIQNGVAFPIILESIDLPEEDLRKLYESARS